MRISDWSSDVCSSDLLTLGEVDGKLITVEEERLLVAALAEFGRAATGKTQDEADFRHYLATLARLRQPVDAFFERVTVNADDAAIRRNRLSLLSDRKSTRLNSSH